MWRRRWYVSLALVVGLVLLPVALLGHIRFHAAQSRVPESGVRMERVAGLDSTVEVLFDGRGVPHVRAASAEDAWFAHGYLHARDRFFQMELARRAAAGRLSEIVGDVALVEDRKARILRLAATARRQAALLSPQEERILGRYADGVNAALERYGRWIAPEIWMLGIDPAPWAVEDSLVIGVMLQLRLTWAMGEELQRSVEYAHLGHDLATGLWGWTPRQARAWIPPGDPVAEPRRQDEPITPPLQGGSNNWALAGTRTDSGRPILANDPHVGVATPATWTAVHLTAPGLDVAGASVAGAPGVLIGHNGTVAWGFTMSMMDDQDLYVVTLDEPAHNELLDGAWAPLRTVTEEIRIRWRTEPEILKVRLSRVGPLLRDRGTEGLALDWTAYRGPSAIRAFLKMNTAKSVAGIRQAWVGIPSPSMNLVAADTDGAILHQVVGQQPNRRRGRGRLPAPGGDSGWAWDGLVSIEANPRTHDPESGFVATANHDLFSEGDYPADLAFAGEFASPWRIRRIRQQLGARSDWTVADCLALQGDVLSGRAVAMLRSLWPDLERHGGPTARALLQWDGRMRREATEPLLYSRLVLELAAAVGSDESVKGNLEHTPLDGDRLLRLLAGGLDEYWWDDVRTEAVEQRADIVEAVLDRLDETAKEAAWGGAHHVEFGHVLRDMPLFGAIFRASGSRGPIGVPGDGSTVNAHYWSSKEPFRVTAIPSLRFVADVGAWDRSILVLPLGQSGRLFSSHYDDQLEAWLEVAPIPFPYTGEAVDDASVARLTLRPEAS